ncbi:MAG: AMP-binding protein [Sciscionella sp.]
MGETHYVEAQAVLEQPTDRVWRVVSNPALYPLFIRDITWCERIGSAGAGRGARYAIRLCFDGRTVRQDELRIRGFREGEHLAWSAVHTADCHGSVRLRPHGRSSTEITVILLLPPSEVRISTADLRRRLRAAVRLVEGNLSGTPAPVLRDNGSRLSTASTLVRSGVLGLARPDRTFRQLNAFARWGPSLVGGYRAAAAREPRALAVHDEHGRHTFEEIDDRSTRLANGLIDRYKLTERSRVAVMCRNHGAIVESLLACGKIGADALLLNTGLSVEQVTDVIRAHRVGILLADDEFHNLTSGVPARCARISTWRDEESDLAHVVGGPTVEQVITRSSSDPFRPVEEPGRVIVLTSGTTGTPKGARRPTPKGLRDAASLLAKIPLRVGERMLIAAPLFHSWGFAGLQLGMSVRARLTLQRRFDAEQTLRAIAENRCTALIAIPIMLQRIMELPENVRRKYDTSSLRVVACSGSAMPPGLVESFMDAFGDVLYNLYGSTEVSWASVADPLDLRAAPGTGGTCPPGTKVGILDEHGALVPTGEIGTIYVGNDMLFEGYTDRQNRDMRQDLMDTGDRGYLDANGRLFVQGRADEMIVSGGENVFPRPVEEMLVALPEVRDAVVVGVPDNEFGQRLAAYIVPGEECMLDANAVRAHIHERLPRFCVPRDVIFVDDLPRNATGKVLKRLLRDGDW